MKHVDKVEAILNGLIYFISGFTVCFLIYQILRTLAN